MLEKMSEFFDSRIDGYEKHQFECIQGAEEFYPYTARCLPCGEGCRILDLGCGTGLELWEYFKTNPTAYVTGIDLSGGMLDVMRERYADKHIDLICASYFDVSLGEAVYDGAVSVESLHHYTKGEKTALYEKLYRALKNGGTFVLTDYFSLSDKEEEQHRLAFAELKRAESADDDEIYHYDTPLTVAHETEALKKAGFSDVEILKNWGATYTIRAWKR